MLVTVKVEDWQLLDMLLDRCDAWETSRENKDLFEKMYSNMIDNCCFEDAELNIMSIVDNDVVNYCSVLYKEDWEKLMKLYNEGEYDVSCEEFEDINPSFIEAISDDEDRILVRY